MGGGEGKRERKREKEQERERRKKQKKMYRAGRVLKGCVVQLFILKMNKLAR